MTCLLETLLSNDAVDHVICVAPTSDPEKLFEFKVFSTLNEVRTGAGSAYYPVEMSAAIREVLETPGRYAIVGLPCFIKAVRLAQKSSIKLRERIIVTIGLVCGQLKNKHFTDYIALSPGCGKRSQACITAGRNEISQRTIIISLSRPMAVRNIGSSGTKASLKPGRIDGSLRRPAITATMSLPSALISLVWTPGCRNIRQTIVELV